MTRLQLRTRSARWALGLLVVSGCFYTFDNPVEKESPGSVGGTVQLQEAVAGQTLAGGHVAVPWTNGLDLTLDSTGRFLFQDLPDGTYSLNVDIPALAANDYPLLLLRPGVSIPNVGGEVDSLDIGTLQVPASGLVGGTVSPPSAGIVVAAFALTAGNIDAGLGTYEGFSTLTDSAGHYQIQLPAGQHVIAASDPQDFALGSASVIPQTTQNLDLGLQQTNRTGLIFGWLVGTGFGASTTNNSIPGQVDFVAVANGTVLSDGGLVPTPDATPGVGSNFTINVAGGNFVTLTLLPPPTASPNPCDAFSPFVLASIPVIAGYDTELGQVSWLSNAALGANGIGPCAPQDGGSGSGTTTGGATGSSTTTGGATGTGTTSGGNGTGGTGWLDAGFLPWDGGQIVQTAVFPFTPDGGRLIAWVATAGSQTNLYYATSLTHYAPAPLTSTGDVVPGTLGGAELNDGVLLSFATATNTATCQFISSVSGPGGIAAPDFPLNSLSEVGLQEIATFTGKLNHQAGAFVLQQVADAGIIGSFTTDGQSFANTFQLLPATTAPINPQTLIAVSCDVSDLSGNDGFCLAGSGPLEDPDAGAETVAFISSVRTDSSTPLIQNTQLLSNAEVEPVYIGLAALPGQVAVSAGQFGFAVEYWQLSSLASAPTPSIQAPPETALLVDWDGRILGLSWASYAGTAGIFLPDGGQAAAIQNLGSGTDILSAAYEPATDSIITAGIPSDDSSSNLSVWQLPNEGGD